jgi:hypothetical protein
MENVSHNTSYSESSPNVHNDEEEFMDESGISPSAIEYDANQATLNSPIA